MVIPLLTALGGVLCCLATAGSALVVLSHFLPAWAADRRLPPPSRTAALQHAAGRLQVLVCAVVGQRWGDVRTALRLVAFYWVFLPTFLFLFQMKAWRDQPQGISNSLWVAVSFHLLIWFQILTDYVSFHVTRRNLQRYIDASAPSPRLLLGLLLGNAAVAFLMLSLAILSANCAYLIARDQDWDAIRTHFAVEVFSWQTATQPFVVVGGPKRLPIPGVVVVSAVTYLPTGAWLVGVGLVLLAQRLLTGLQTVQASLPAGLRRLAQHPTGVLVCTGVVPLAGMGGLLLLGQAWRHLFP